MEYNTVDLLYAIKIAAPVVDPAASSNKGSEYFKSNPVLGYTLAAGLAGGGLLGGLAYLKHKRRVTANEEEDDEKTKSNALGYAGAGAAASAGGAYALLKGLNLLEEKKEQPGNIAKGTRYAVDAVKSLLAKRGLKADFSTGSYIGMGAPVAAVGTGKLLATIKSYRDKGKNFPNFISPENLLSNDRKGIYKGFESVYGKTEGKRLANEISGVLAAKDPTSASDLNRHATSIESHLSTPKQHNLLNDAAINDIVHSLRSGEIDGQMLKVLKSQGVPEATLQSLVINAKGSNNSRLSIDAAARRQSAKAALNNEADNILQFLKIPIVDNIDVTEIGSIANRIRSGELTPDLLEYLHNKGVSDEVILSLKSIKGKAPSLDPEHIKMLRKVYSYNNFRNIPILGTAFKGLEKIVAIAPRNTAKLTSNIASRLLPKTTAKLRMPISPRIRGRAGAISKALLALTAAGGAGYVGSEMYKARNIPAASTTIPNGKK